MNKRLNIAVTSEDGFTLIELVIVIAVSSVLLLGMLNLFDWHQKIYLQETANIGTTTAVRGSLLKMSKNIAQATTVMASHTFGSTTYTSGASELVLQLPSVNSSGNAIATTYDYVAYYLSGGALYEKIEANAASTRLATTKLIAENAQTFTLTYDTATPAAASYISIILEDVIATRTNNATTRLTDTIFLRNK